MRKWYLLIVGLFILQSLVAQKISISTEDLQDSVQIKVEISEGWHLYSMHSNPNIGPIPTKINFEPNDQVTLVGGVKEPTPITKYDPNFKGELKFFNNQVVFTQKIKSTETTQLKGSIMYMVCNNEQCMPPVDKEFIIELKR